MGGEKAKPRLGENYVWSENEESVNEEAELSIGGTDDDSDDGDNGNDTKW